ncbi:hypothetical protein DH2020_015499 [Rehmannia glutinosa]|uniref:Alginate lyase 2 domain-containing protein n=1 Tax=Rehmannia glutinosa TaxID=99300 RepID=A0ABR0WW48_REHGL
MGSASLSSCLQSMFVVLITLYRVVGWGPVVDDPTKGFISQYLNESNLVVQRPYDIVSENQRYSFKNGVHKLWVQISLTLPSIIVATEDLIRRLSFQGYDYSSGVWQFEAYGHVPGGTTGVCVMQVFGSDPPHATTLMLRVYNGTLSYYRAPVIVPNIYDRWFKLNVIHDVEASKVKVYIDGVLKFEALGRGGHSHYFKCGVYAQNNSSYYMESRWKNIRLLKKCD